MHYLPPPETVKTEMVFCVKDCSNYLANDEDELSEIYDKYRKIIHPMNQALFNIILELKKMPDDEETMQMLEIIFAFREEIIEFLGLEQADRSMVPKGPWPPRKSD